jgi:hypothetical protein
MAQVVELLPSKCEALSLNPSTTKKKGRGKITSFIRQQEKGVNQFDELKKKPLYLLGAELHLYPSTKTLEITDHSEFILFCFSVHPPTT